MVGQNKMKTILMNKGDITCYQNKKNIFWQEFSEIFFLFKMRFFPHIFSTKETCEKKLILFFFLSFKFCLRQILGHRKI